jgi:beta-barrel assembly-enhancing protease
MTHRQNGPAGALSASCTRREGLGLLLPAGCGVRQVPAPEVPLPPIVFQPLQEALQKSYDELFRIAPTLEFSASEIAKMREYIEGARKHCTAKFEARAKAYESELDAATVELRRKTKSIDEAARNALHCRIQNARILKSEAETLANHAVPVAFENRTAKLDVIEKWPGELRRIREAIRNGSYKDRPYGDIADIGFREVGKGQEDDVRRGQQAIDEMRQMGMFPKDLDDEPIQKYVQDLTVKIAANSDIRVPVQVKVLNSREINAFALPGGFLFVQRGLLEQVDDEAQLAGVMAHELSHAVARHGHRLMKRATIASIIFQAAQVAAMIFTGGVAGIGTYYALQYGFYGLGLVLNLDLLGVSRDFELEADQLGVQYSWKAGYDPTGFVRFFDKLAQREGYVQGLSWFRTHPPFFDRMMKTQEEILYLPKKEALVQQSTAFLRMKERLGKLSEPAEEDRANAPTLKGPEKDCPPVKKIGYKPGQRIEEICDLPMPEMPEKRLREPS